MDRRSMTSAALASALAVLNWTPYMFAQHVDRHERTVRRWLYGESPIPSLVEREVAFLLIPLVEAQGADHPLKTGVGE